MRNKMIRSLLLTFLGLAILVAGVVLLVTIPQADGAFKTLSFICIGVGAGVIGGSLGSVAKHNIARKDPEAYKRVEIEEKDERNVAIANRAKAQAFSVFLIAFSVLILAFAFTQAPLYVVLSLVAVYLFAVCTMIYYLSKYHKEM